jgi:hypothetical protein
MSWLLFTSAFMLEEIFLRLSSVDDQALMFWALTNTPSRWALLLLLGTAAWAAFIFTPLQLPFLVWWTAQGKKVAPGARGLLLLLPGLVVTAWWAMETLNDLPDSKAYFETQLKRGLPEGAANYMAIHPLGTGAFARTWGSVSTCRMLIPEHEARQHLRRSGAAQYQFEVEALPEPFDAAFQALPQSWGYAFGHPALEFHQLPPGPGGPAYGIIDANRGELVLMVEGGNP